MSIFHEDWDHWCPCCGADDRDPGCCQNLTEAENIRRLHRKFFGVEIPAAPFVPSKTSTAHGGADHD